MRKISLEQRRRTFQEASLGFTEEEAMEEASRCLQCKNPPCVSGCPVNIDIPAFIDKIKQGRFSDALEIIKRTNNLPAICGRVCPQEKQCEAKCVLEKKGEAINLG